MRTSSEMRQLMLGLERLERSVRKTATQSRSDAQFHETLTDLLVWLRRTESLDLAVLKLKARLTQTYRSLMILPSTPTTLDPATSLECFGLTFKAKHPLSAHDRRFLKANAQLISLLEQTRREMQREADAGPRSPQIVHSAADWLMSQSAMRPALSLPRPAPIAQPVANSRKPIVESDEIDFFAALMRDHAVA
jgi:hypothetical protein